MRKFVTYILILALFSISVFAWLRYTNDKMAEESLPFIYKDVRKIPNKQAVLLLGTTKYLSNGKPNYFYKYRIDATIKLFEAGKIKAVLVSGDNGTKAYDEATDMHDDLVKRGIPSEYITLDYAGFRTLDSVVRAKAIFDLEDYIIVSQQFHLERALYLAHAKHQKAIGFVAQDFKNTVWAKRMEHRELLARAKAFLDIHLLATEPKFYGEKVEMNYMH